ncbi:hypothetical protein PSCLAVI8L_90009 [Pseudoclavibacter sp. 8L]|nr:hypothetical protein PSCLAVI8L_90009 [Pseudoclavibacter sp. 8L]
MGQDRRPPQGAGRVRAHGRVPPRLPPQGAAPPRHRLVVAPAQAALAVRVPRHVRDAAAGLGRGRADDVGDGWITRRGRPSCT